MVPVYQTMTVANDGEGNCFNACIASILELPLRDVALIHPKHPDYWQAWDDWFAGRGQKIEFRVLNERRSLPKGYCIVSGRSSRLYPEGHAKAGERIHHACVAFDGVVVHDPFPLPGEFGEISAFFTISQISLSQL